jgi:hypothetical protein
VSVETLKHPLQSFHLLAKCKQVQRRHPHMLLELQSKGNTTTLCTLTSTMLLVATWHCEARGADEADTGDAGTGERGGSPASRLLLLRLMCANWCPTAPSPGPGAADASADGSSRTGLSLAGQCWEGLPPWDDTLLTIVLLRMVLLLLLLLLWRMLCLAWRRSDSSRQAMEAGMHCVIRAAGNKHTHEQTNTKQAVRRLPVKFDHFGLGSTCRRGQACNHTP